MPRSFFFDEHYIEIKKRTSRLREILKDASRNPGQPFEGIENARADILKTRFYVVCLEKSLNKLKLSQNSEKHSNSIAQTELELAKLKAALKMCINALNSIK